MNIKRLFTFWIAFTLFMVAGCTLCHARQPETTVAEAAGRAPLIDRAKVMAVAAETTAGKFPDADNVILDDYTVERYNPDGTGSSFNEWYEKILTEKGRRESRTASLWMNTSYGAVAVEFAELIKPDGTVVPIDIEANSRVMIDPGQMGSNIYDPNNKIFTAVFPGMEVGDVLHIGVERITTKPRVPNQFSSYMVFEMTFPIISMTREIVAPAELPLAKIKVRDEIGDGVKYEKHTLENGDARHVWSVKDVEQIFPEPNMPEWHACVQRVLVSTMADWEDLSRWYWKISEPRMGATVPEMQTEVDAIVAGAESRDEKIWRLFSYVSQKIRYMGVTPEDEAPGYEPHDVSLTYLNKYGVCRDKAALLVVMLRMAGIEAYPVIIHAGERKDPDVPQLAFNHAIVAARPEDTDVTGADKYILMDPTNESSSRLLPEYLCEKSFIVATPDGEGLMESAALPAEGNMVSIETESRVEGDWQLADTRIVFKGVNDTMYRGAFADMSADDRRNAVEGMLQSALPGASLTRLEMVPDDMQDTATPLELLLGYAVPGSVLTGGVTVVTLPRVAEAFGYVNFLEGRTGLEKRRFPMDTSIPCGVEERVALHPGFDADGFEWGGDALTEAPGVSFAQSAAVSNGAVLCESSFVMSKSLYSPEEYPGLRAVFTWKEKAGRAVGVWPGARGGGEAGDAPEVVARIPPADTRVLLREVEAYPVAESNGWVEVLHERIEVLTYAGKVDSGDLMFSYNPATERVEVLSAEVTSPDGRVHKATDLEINVMDQSWVASAPRYPAGKTLVISLPGLEIGSVVDYTIRRELYGKPACAFRIYFGGFSDVEKQILRLRAGGDGSVFHNMEAGEAIEVVHTNMAGMLRERNMPPPRHLFEKHYSVETWFDAWEYGRIIESNMVGKARDRKRATAKAAELTAGIQTKRGKVRAIRDFAAKEIRVVGVSFYDFPLSSISPADATIEAGYGHGMDVAVLVYAMLDSVGLRPRIILGDSSRLPADGDDAAVDGNGFLDVVLVAVDDGDETYYVNDGSEYSDLRATGADGVVCADLDKNKWYRLELPEEFADSVSTRYDVEVLPDRRVVVDVTREYRGTTAEGFRRLYSEITPEDRRRHVLETVSSYSRGAVLEGKYETDVESYPALEKFRMSIPSWAVEEGGAMSVRLVGSERTAVGPRYGERAHPFYRENVNRFRDEWNLLFPAEVQSASLLPRENDFDRADICTVLNTECLESRAEDGRLRVSVVREAVLERAMFGGADYHSFMESALNTRGRAADTVVLELSGR